jgi:hypothetical protein
VVSLWRHAFTSLALLIVLFAGMPPAASAAAVGSGQQLQPGPGRLSLEYRPARTASDRRGRRLWRDGFLERVVARLNSRITLPVDVRIVVGPGESGDAPSGRTNPVLKVGYAFPAELRPLFNRYGVFTRAGRRVRPITPARRPLRRRAIQETLHAVVLHELGHAYTGLWPIPTTSDDETIADVFASWAAVEVLDDPDAVLYLANFRLGVSTLGAAPGIAAWNRATGYADLFRLIHARPRRYRAVRRLLPRGYLQGETFIGGPWAGIRNALQPIALVPLEGAADAGAVASRRR